MKKYKYRFADGSVDTVEVSDEVYQVLQEHDIIDTRIANARKYNFEVELTEDIPAPSIDDDEEDSAPSYPTSVYRQIIEFENKLSKTQINLTEKEKVCANAYLRTGSLRKAAIETGFSKSTVKNMFDSVLHKLR